MTTLDPSRALPTGDLPTEPAVRAGADLSTPRWRRVLHGPLPRLPAPLDATMEGWWRLPPRLRLAATLVVVGLVAVGLALHTTTSRWGPATPVVVATAAAEAGQPLATTHATWPADLVPPDALATPPDGVATRHVRAGEVVTATHVATDLSDLLGHDEVALNLPSVPDGLPRGATLDLLGTDFDGTGRRLGRGRLVAVRQDGAWVVVDRGDAPAVAAALATGQVTVALAPGG